MKSKILKFIIFVSVLPLLSVCVCSAQTTDDKISIDYACFDLKGNERWKATIKITPLSDRPDNIYLMVEEAEGCFTGFDHEISWVAELEYEDTEDTIRPLKLEKRTYDDDGKLIIVENQTFNYLNKEVFFTRRNYITGEKVERSYKFNGDIINRLSLSLYVQKLLKKGKKEARTQVFSSRPYLYAMDIKIIDEEKIELNGDKKTAYKLYLDPDIGMLNILKVIIPKAYTWHSASPDFEWLKYTGPESSAFSTEVEINTLN